jgi:hypothetical protein
LDPVQVRAPYLNYLRGKSLVTKLKAARPSSGKSANPEMYPWKTGSSPAAACTLSRSRLNIGNGKALNLVQNCGRGASVKLLIHVSACAEPDLIRLGDGQDFEHSKIVVVGSSDEGDLGLDSGRR